MDCLQFAVELWLVQSVLDELAPVSRAVAVNQIIGSHGKWEIDTWQEAE